MYLCCFFFFSFPFGGVPEPKNEAIQELEWKWTVVIPVSVGDTCFLFPISYPLPVPPFLFFFFVLPPRPGWPFVELNG